MTVRLQLEAVLEERHHKRELAGMARTLKTDWAGDFSHNDYLGLARDPAMRKRLGDAVGAGLVAGSTGSRLLSGGHPVFRKLEEEFASATGTEAALFFASASEANRAAVTTLVSRHDVVVLDELAHASLWDGALHSGAKRLRFAHNDPDSLRRTLREAPASKVRLVLVESVYSMDGDAAPLVDLLRVCEEEDALLLVDEAHGTGIYGANRTGLSEGLPRSGALVATVHGCGKALGSAGGVLCAPRSVVTEIVNSCREFIFTTAPSPLAAWASLEGLLTSRREPWRVERLFSLAHRLDAGLRAMGFAQPPSMVPTAIFPLLCHGLEPALALRQKMSKSGFELSVIRSPTVAEGTERLRLTLCATLEDSTLDGLLAALEER
ncbi:MAG: biotin synthase BioB [Fibrobacterota bacterium]|jgi:8-amino-7-oxononanoate synthase